MAEFNKSEIIHSSRIYHKFTRAAASEGICDELTLLRYEKGHLSVSPKNFHDIMERMGEPGETIILPYTQDDVHIINLQNQILNALQRCNYAECEDYTNQLLAYQNFNTSIIENKQYLERIQLTIQYMKKELTPEEYIVQLINILQYTFKDFNNANFPPHKIFTETELSILNNIATTYIKLDRTSLALSLFERLFKYCKSISNHELSKPLYSILINYSSLLISAEFYQKCIDVSLFGINWLKHRDYQNLLYSLYFNLGRSLIKVGRELNDNTLEIKGKIYVDQSSILCSFFPEATKNKIQIKKFIANNYNDFT